MNRVLRFVPLDNLSSSDRSYVTTELRRRRRGAGQNEQSSVMWFRVLGDLSGFM